MRIVTLLSSHDLTSWCLLQLSLKVYHWESKLNDWFEKIVIVKLYLDGIRTNARDAMRRDATHVENGPDQDGSGSASRGLTALRYERDRGF